MKSSVVTSACMVWLSLNSKRKRMAQRVVLRRKISMRRRSYAMYSGELIYVDHKQYRRLRSFWRDIAVLLQGYAPTAPALRDFSL